MRAVWRPRRKKNNATSPVITTTNETHGSHAFTLNTCIISLAGLLIAHEHGAIGSGRRRKRWKKVEEVASFVGPLTYLPLESRHDEAHRDSCTTPQLSKTV